jgi:hypothetical protein
VYPFSCTEVIHFLWYTVPGNSNFLSSLSKGCGDWIQAWCRSPGRTGNTSGSCRAVVYWHQYSRTPCPRFSLLSIFGQGLGCVMILCVSCDWFHQYTYMTYMYSILGWMSTEVLPICISAAPFGTL